MQALRDTLRKRERLCSKKDISVLLAKGKSANAEMIRCRFIKGTGSGDNRIMVSVPKKLIRRAVKRNLLKRRIRESYRHQKHRLNDNGTDILFMYSTPEIMPYKEIYAQIGLIIDKINSNGHRHTEKTDPKSGNLSVHSPDQIL